MSDSKMLTANQVSYAFTPGQDALSCVSAQFRPGVLSCIIGPNGSGKSTLLRLLGGLLTPDTGDIKLSDTPIGKLSRKETAKKIALVPQREEILPEMAVLDMVLLGRTPYLSPFATESEEDKKLAIDAMMQTETLHLQDRNIATLSGGELQRVAIARALCQTTPILLLDEPVASLDIKHQVAIMQLLAKLTKEKGLGVVCILHDLNLAAHFAEYILLLSNGIAMACGEPAQVLTNELLAKSYGIAVRKIEQDGAYALTPDFGAWE